MLSDMLDFLTKLQGPSLNDCLHEFFPSYESMLDVYNVDLPNAANLTVLKPDLDDILEKFCVRKYSVCGGALKAGRNITVMRVP
jgi:hypothetical protein